MDHSWIKISYDNDSGSIADDFLVPCLKSFKTYRRTTYSFSSGALKAWAGAFTALVSKDIKIEILCDMSEISTNDNQLCAALEGTLDREQRLAIIADKQDNILLDALSFDMNSERVDTRKSILEWMLATERLELRFAWPRSIQSGSLDLQPLYHKKMGYFVFFDSSRVSFSGSWNETMMGSKNNLEDCSVFSSKNENDRDRMLETIQKVDADWSGANSKFDVLPVSRKFLDAIKKRALDNPFPPIDNPKSSKTFNENDLRSYQLEVLNSWEKHDRRGIVKHATGSGKTFTAIFALKRHLNEGGIGLIIVPSRLLLDQWNVEVGRIIPETKNHILNIGTGYRTWKKNLNQYSRPGSQKNRIIIAIANSARSNEFLGKIEGGDHLMIIADEVHRLGSPEYSQILNNLDSGPRLGLSATPERYMDPIGTKRIFDYFGDILKPEYDLNDAIKSGALVPYNYFPEKCNLTEEELEEWSELSLTIGRLFARLKKNKAGERIPSIELQLKLIERARIAKQAENKTRVATRLLIENYQPGQQWLVYCDSQEQMRSIYESLAKVNASSHFYHSKMPDLEKKETLSYFKTNGGILLSIKCLDEGIDIPSITHALIVASDQNPRQFIQRRGRVLRPDKNNLDKKMAFIWDIIVTVSGSKEDSVKSLCISELKRSMEFSSYADNREISSKKLRDIARSGNVTFEDIEDSFEQIEDEDI